MWCYQIVLETQGTLCYNISCSLYAIKHIKDSVPASYKPVLNVVYMYLICPTICCLIAGCPSSNPHNYYISDDSNPCIFYQCVGGEMISMMHCAAGTGVKRAYHGMFTPCVTKNVKCKGQSITICSHLLYITIYLCIRW